MGYPENFGEALVKHQAGNEISLNDFPQRYTDIEIRNRYTITPLDIAANLISRTTFSILRRVSSLKRFQLVWNNNFEKFGMIEVYPKATLIANFEKKDIEKYKGNKDVNKQKRKEIFNQLKQKYPLSDCIFPESEHDFDALICCLAGLDFLQEKCFSYDKTKTKTVEKEGWIWVKKAIK
jgi:hypothetical protein